MALKLKKNWIPFTIENFVSCLIEISPAVEEIFKSCLYIFNWLLLSPLRKRAWSFIWKKLNSLNSRISVPSLVEIGPVVLEKKSSDSMYFHFVAIISLWQRAWSFICTNLNHLHFGMLYVKYGETWLGDSEEVNMWQDMEWHLVR